MVHLDAQVVAVEAKGIAAFASFVARYEAGTITYAQLRSGVEGLPSTHEDALWKKLGVAVCAKP